MSIVDRINTWLVNRIRRKTGDWMGPVIFDATEVRMMNDAKLVWRKPWAKVERIQGFQNPGHMSNSLTLLFEGDGQRGLVSEDIEGWKALVDAIPEHLPGSAQHAEWALRLIANGQQAIETVYLRSTAQRVDGA